MSHHPKLGVRLLAGGAAGTLALATLALAPLSSAAASTTPPATSPSRAATPPAAVAAAQNRYVVRTARQLRGAVAKANQHPGRDRIDLAADFVLDRGAGTGGGVGDGDLEVNDELYVAGNGHSIGLKRRSRLFEVTSPDTRLVIDSLTMYAGTPEVAGDNGGFVSSAGTLVLREVSAIGGRVDGETGSGGAFYNDGGRLVVWRSQILGSSAVRAGGGVEASEGSTTVFIGSLVRGNAATGGVGEAPGNGGAFHQTGSGTVRVASTTMLRNSAAKEGGALWNGSGEMVVRDGSVISRNQAAGDEADDGGGGIFNNTGSLTVLGGRVNLNDATGTSGSGGGILNLDGDLSVRGTQLIQNTANRAGGALEANDLAAGDNAVTLDNVNLRRNVAGGAGANPGNGGAVHLTGTLPTSTFDISNSVVTGGLASREGGGLWNDSGWVMTVDATRITDNEARGDAADDGGGGIFNNGGALSVVNGSVVEGNSATGTSGSGGGILNLAGQLTVSDTVLDGNSASRAGGGIETTGGNTDVDGTDITDNSTGSAPGNGGGVHAGGTANVTVTGGTVTGNGAANEGGGVWNANGAMTLTGVTLDGNTADSDPDPAVDGDQAYNEEGGGVLVVNGTPVLPGTGI